MESIYKVWGVHGDLSSYQGLPCNDAMNQNCHIPHTTINVIQLIRNRTMILYASNHVLPAKCNVL